MSSTPTTIRTHEVAMIYPIQDRPYSARRKRWENDLQIRNYSDVVALDTVGGEQVIVRKSKKYHNLFTNPIFSILESRRTSGSLVYDYSGNGNSFDVLGFNSNVLSEGYWQYKDCYRCPRAAPAEPFPALLLDGSSYLRSAATFNFNVSFTIGGFIRRAGIGVEEYLFSKAGAINLRMSSGNALVFETIGSSTASVTCSKLMNDTDQHFVAARWNKSTETISVMVDDTITNAAGLAAIDTSLVKLYLFARASDQAAKFSGYAHSFFMTLDALSDADIAALRDQIEPYGCENTINEYDDASGTNTGEPYALWKRTLSHPYMPYHARLTYSYTDDIPDLAESIL